MTERWLKLRVDLPTDPRVVRIAEALFPDDGECATSATRCATRCAMCATPVARCYIVVGALATIWGAAQAHSRGGVFANCGLSYLDTVCGIGGFGALMESVGWARYDADHHFVELPNFHEHNIERSQIRSPAAERMARVRERRKAKKASTTQSATHVAQQRNTVAQRVAQHVAQHVALDKKRKEEKGNGAKAPFASSDCSTPPAPPEHTGVGPVFACSGKPDSSGVRPTWQADAALVETLRDAYPGVDVMGELRKAAAWCETNPTRRKTVRGMPRFLQTWVARQQDRGGTKPAKVDLPGRPVRNPFSEAELAEDAQEGGKSGASRAQAGRGE